MINVIPTSPSGVTSGIEALIKVMQDNPDELMGLLKVTRTQRDEKGDTHQFPLILLQEDPEPAGVGSSVGLYVIHGVAPAGCRA